MNSITQNSLISQLLKRKIVSINENKPIFKAINMLAKHNIGALPVLNSKRELCGIISERDILRQLSKDIGITHRRLQSGTLPISISKNNIWRFTTKLK